MDRLSIAKNFGNLLQKRYPDIVRVVLFRNPGEIWDSENEDVGLLVVSLRDSFILKRQVMKDAISMVMRTGIHLPVRTISLEAYNRIAKTSLILETERASILVG